MTGVLVFVLAGVFVRLAVNEGVTDSVGEAEFVLVAVNVGLDTTVLVNVGVPVLVYVAVHVLV